VSEAWCKCGAAQKGAACGCGILERRDASYELPVVKPAVVGGDLADAVAMLAADNCRLIDIALAADWLEDAARALVQDANPSLYTNLRAALTNYKLVKAGQ
jgi:hypothetical protein